VYDWLAGRPRTIGIQLEEIAGSLASRIDRGRLLDVGTGHGRLLGAIHGINPRIELYGLDISAAMVERARRNLRGLPIDVRQANIRRTAYEDGFFDLVTGTGTLYLWDEPAEGLREVHRILARGGSAHLFEPHAGATEEELRRIGVALRRETPVRRVLGPVFIRTAVRAGLRVGDTRALLDAGPFRASHTVEKVTLGGLPVWLHLTLEKPGAGGAPSAL